VHQEIDLDALAIDVPHQFHEPDLDAARIQRPEHVQDANGLMWVHANWWQRRSSRIRRRH
jgi:hypothetical protein